MTEKEKTVLADIRGYINWVLNTPDHRLLAALATIAHDINLIMEKGVDPEDGSAPQTSGYARTARTYWYILPKDGAWWLVQNVVDGKKLGPFKTASEAQDKAAGAGIHVHGTQI